MASDLNKYIGNKIRSFRKEKNLTAEDLANKLGISRATITRYETGVRNTNQDVLYRLADILGVSINDFFPSINGQPTNVYPLSKNIVKVPVIGQIAMGMPITAEQNIEGYDAIELQYDTPADELFELECKGHSMEPTIPDGAIGLFEITNEVEDGEIAAVQVDHDEEATLKRIQHSKDQVLLKPDNPNYPTLTIDKDHPGRIVGRLLEYRVKMHRN